MFYGVADKSGLSACEPVSRWKRRKEILAVRKGATCLYPAFQGENGQPRPVIGKILAEIVDKCTAWQIVFWFESSMAG